MKILPDDYRGHHPAFSAFPEDSLRHRIGVTSFVPLSGGVAFSLGTICAIARHPQPWATATKAAAYITTGLAAYSIATGYLKERNARTFLRSQGIEPPKGRWLARVGHYDLDDSVLLGGFLGILVAFMRKSPSPVLGWKRYVGAFTFGGSCRFVTWFVKDIGEIIRVGGSADFQRAEQRDQELLKEEAKWQSTVRLQLGRMNERLPQSASVSPSSMNDSLKTSNSSLKEGVTDKPSGSQGDKPGIMKTSGARPGT